MNFLTKIVETLSMVFSFLWRCWFISVNIVYVLLTLAIGAPFFFIHLPLFMVVLRVWFSITMTLSGLFWKAKWDEELDKNQSYIFVSNHCSLLDILLLIITVRKNPLVFIGKKEVSKVFFIGYFYAKMVIMIDRENSKSANLAYREARNRLKNGVSVCFFAEGGVPRDRSIVLAPFKKGAFQLAKELNLPIVPVSITGTKKCYPFTWKKGGPGLMRLHFHSPIQPEFISEKSVDEISNTVYKIIYDSLIKKA